VRVCVAQTRGEGVGDRRLNLYHSSHFIIASNNISMGFHNCYRTSFEVI
jgi:hypothetical protein